jgi:hypothetical protein
MKIYTPKYAPSSTEKRALESIYLEHQKEKLVFYF